MRVARYGVRGGAVRYRRGDSAGAALNVAFLVGWRLRWRRRRTSR